MGNLTTWLIFFAGVLIAAGVAIGGIVVLVRLYLDLKNRH